MGEFLRGWEIAKRVNCCCKLKGKKIYIHRLFRHQCCTNAKRACHIKRNQYTHFLPNKGHWYQRNIEFSETGTIINIVASTMSNNADLTLLLKFRKCSRRFKAGHGCLVESGRRSRVFERSHQGIWNGEPTSRGRARLDPLQRYRARSLRDYQVVTNIEEE